MSEYPGRVRLVDEQGPGLAVTLDLENEHLIIRSSVGEIGAWSIHDVRITAHNDGFHLRAEGDEVVITTADDPGFAIEVGLKTAPPLLRRQMSARLRGEHAAGDLPPVVVVADEEGPLDQSAPTTS